jgi:hypothetical protein
MLCCGTGEPARLDNPAGALVGAVQVATSAAVALWAEVDRMPAT